MHKLRSKFFIPVAVVIFLAAVAFVFLPTQPHNQTQSVFAGLSPAQKALVAHAGGAINGKIYTNSLEALERSYQRGFRLFELDFHWTQDQKIVLIHDWQQAPGILFKNLGSHPTYQDFMSATMKHNLTQLDLAKLEEWLRTKKDALIITDFKTQNLAGLKFITEQHPYLSQRLMPQITSFENYNAIKELGFHSIILTLYRMEKVHYENLRNFLQAHPVFALVFPVQHTKHQGFMQFVQQLKQRIFVHTVNNLKQKNMLFTQKITGFYTDIISPEHYHK